MLASVNYAAKVCYRAAVVKIFKRVEVVEGVFSNLAKRGGEVKVSNKLTAVERVVAYAFKRIGEPQLG